MASRWNTLPGLNLDIAYQNYLDKALATDDRRQFDLATMGFVARLHNGHTFFSDSWLTQRYGQGLGFYARPLDGKWVVSTLIKQRFDEQKLRRAVDDFETVRASKINRIQ